MKHLTAASKRCLAEAQRQSRQLDDNHVGTEHIVLGVLAPTATSPRCWPATASPRRCSVPGSSKSRGPALTGTSPDIASPDDPRPGPVRSSRRRRRDLPRHLTLGVIAESRDRRRRGFDGPHDLEQAAAAAGQASPRSNPFCPVHSRAPAPTTPPSTGRGR